MYLPTFFSFITLFDFPIMTKKTKQLCNRLIPMEFNLVSLYITHRSFACQARDQTKSFR